ncbi:MAG: hypothetical protein IT328_03675 [Caldilineaceae bacterium]|nr:hypothetical protein [Caldilineaceae bacterium]
MPTTHTRFATLAGSHDLRLPAWGPYSKRYVGVSHIPDVRAGLRFDLSVFPGLYRRAVQVPNVMWESGYHPWEAAPDLSYYSHRHQLIWRDQLTYDIAYCRLDENAVLVHCTALNQSDALQQLSLHYAAALHFPPLEPYSREVLQPDKVSLPHGAVWVNAIHYRAVEYAGFDPRANLTWDGQVRGEIRAHGFVDGLGLGGGWGATVGDRVHYRVTLSEPMINGMLWLRARWPKGERATIRLDGIGKASIKYSGSGDELHLFPFWLGPLTPGEYDITFTILDKDSDLPEIEINGFVVVDEPLAEEVIFSPAIWNPVPTRLPSHRPENTLMLKYDHANVIYGLAWGMQPSLVREVYAESLDEILRLKVHEHVATTFQGEGKGHYTNILMQPIFLPPGESHTTVGLVCSGSQEAVYARLAAFDPSPDAWHATVAQARSRVVNLTPNPAGEPYRSSQERMAATLSTNVVYPIRTRGTWIRNYTPGRWWDCLYTWDSGFIGLGLLEFDIERAIDVLNAYVTEPGDRDAAFIHHGSPVPTQFYLFMELWNRTQDRELLAYFYPRLQQYHRFLMGRLGSSTTRTLQSGLIRTWDYWYNSGGWDDYPPQVYARTHDLYAFMTPVVNSAHAIRTAKILRMAASALGEAISEYDTDIVELSQALQDYAWDEEAGYFSYVLHDDEGVPRGFLRHSSGVNFNMGMDGASPLVADCCTPAQTSRLIEQLMTPGRMGSPIGLSTVDQRAPYYRNDGYWNGAVWMAHQWFFWKALLDQGAADAAYHIAETALTIWQQEVDRTYNCFEHFVIDSGRGAGWHHFGALSAPVVNWYSAYHRPGHFTTGHNVWIESLSIAPDHSKLAAALLLYGNPGQTPVVLATLAADRSYSATWNGTQVPCKTRVAGTVEITLPSGNGSGQLVVQANSLPV